MKILVYAHQLLVGGTTTNAVDLAQALRDLHGHDIVFCATPGPLVSLVRDKGLRFAPAPQSFVHPAPVRMRALRALVELERPDVIHAWDWFQGLEAYYGVYLPLGVPLVISDMTMNVTRLLPKRVPTTFGTPELVDRARSEGRKSVELIVPPVDIAANEPDVVDATEFRIRHAIKEEDITLVTVSRLASFMKAATIAESIKAVRELGRQFPLRLIVVGDGEARSQLQSLANDTNSALARSAVSFAGELLDPRPAYAVADIVIGMGGSALRGMAFGKPLIIVGENGFSGILTPDSAESFYYKGMYGYGNAYANDLAQVRNIRDLVSSGKDSLSVLGRFAQQFVLSRFSLNDVSARLVAVLRSAVDSPERRTPQVLLDGLRTAAIYVRERKFLIQAIDRTQLPKVPSETGTCDMGGN